MRDYDIIIIGAGSAGCVLACRLGEDTDHRILVIEAGGDDRTTIVRMPAAVRIVMNSRRFNWGFRTEPEPYLDGRVVNLPRGKGLGGSSSINGMCWVRGNPMDFELWAARGATGWNWANVLPYYRRMESVEGGGTLRGTDGPIRITHGPGTNPLYRAFIEAGVQAGYAESANMNDVQHEGFGPMEMNVGGGVRCSAARAYLRPAVARGNVDVLTHAHVSRILFTGRRATGVEFIRHGRVQKVMTGGEVILSAGSIMSPVVLKRSGIGPGEELRGAGIETVHHLPGVGENLMDHLEINVQQACIKPVSLYDWMNPFGKALIGLRWLLRRDGLGASNHFEAGAHIRSRAGISYPDIQMHFLPLAVSNDGQNMINRHGYQVHVGSKRSKSRGWVRLDPADPMAAPKVLFNYMSHEDDWLEMRAAIRLAREVFAQEAFAPYRGEELAPGPDCQSDEALDAFIKARAASAFHPSGTCRMGTDEMAVADPEGRVRGIDGLRVVDSSVLPQATAGDLNAPTMVMAERMSDLIRGRPGLTDDCATLLIDPEWRSRQRSARITSALTCTDASMFDLG